MNQKYLKYKYRQAAANLAKQPKNPYLSKMDPLTMICSERLKIIKKSKSNLNIQQKNQVNRQLKTLKEKQDLNKTKHIKKKNKKEHIAQEKQYKSQQNWLKYLPQQYDEFGQKQPNIGNLQKQKVIFEPNKKKVEINQLLQNTEQVPKQTKQKTQIKQTEQIVSGQCQQQIKDIEFDLDQLKIKLGIGVKEDIFEQAEQKCEQVKVDKSKQSPEAAMLPFDGRPFVQAPPRPTPKKIYEYPPTCKVAGLYPWPPPKSQWRSWKAQMKQSRKLN